MVEIKLQAQSIPYEITGGRSFYAKTEMDVRMAYLRLIINPDGVACSLDYVTLDDELAPPLWKELGECANKRNISLSPPLMKWDLQPPCRPITWSG